MSEAMIDQAPDAEKVAADFLNGPLMAYMETAASAANPSRKHADIRRYGGVSCIVQDVGGTEPGPSSDLDLDRAFVICQKKNLGFWAMNSPEEWWLACRKVAEKIEALKRVAGEK